jgi:hypothetical protein
MVVTKVKHTSIGPGDDDCLSSEGLGWDRHLHTNLRVGGKSLRHFGDFQAVQLVEYGSRSHFIVEIKEAK